MPKGYWIAHVEVNDPDLYVNYVEGAKAAFDKWKPTVLARGGAYVELEGAMGRSRHVVLEFESLAAAQACYASREYQAAKAHRTPVSEATIVLVEGAD
ncbi:MAG: DUF1330 domain-containing protein [Pseudomonadota bacterium]